MILIIKFLGQILQGKIKIIFRNPNEKNLIVFDNTSFDDLNNILKNRQYSILPVRSNQIREIFISFKILYQVIKNFIIKFNKKKTTNFTSDLWTSYLIAIINLQKPKLIISHIDNSKKYSEVSKTLNRNYNFLTIQNAARYDKLIESLNTKEFENPQYKFIQNFCCFGEYEVDLYKKLGFQVNKFYIIGSLRKSNFFNYIKEKKINLDKNYYDIGVLIEVPLEIPKLENNIEHFVKPIKYSIEYCQKKNLKPIFIGKWENLNDQLNIFKTYLDEKEINYILNNSIPRDKNTFSSYMAVFQSKILIGVASTLLREKISNGEKILCCNFSESRIWDFPIKGICFTNIANYRNFSDKLDLSLSLTFDEYSKKLDKEYNYILMEKNNYSPITDLNKIIDNYLKKA